MHVFETLREFLLVHVQHRLDEHAQCHVDETQLVHREVLRHQLEQAVGKHNVIAAVLTVSCEFFWCEVNAPFVDSGNHLFTLDTNTVPFSQRFERATCLYAVKRTCDTQRVQVDSGSETEHPIKYRTVKQRVVGQHHGVAPVKLRKPLAHRFTVP